MTLLPQLSTGWDHRTCCRPRQSCCTWEGRDPFHCWEECSEQGFRDSNYLCFSWLLKSNSSPFKITTKIFLSIPKSWKYSPPSWELGGLCFLIQTNHTSIDFISWWLFNPHFPNLFISLWNYFPPQHPSPFPKLTHKSVRNGCFSRRIHVTTQIGQLDLRLSDPFATNLTKWTRHRLETKYSKHGKLSDVS